MNSCARWFFVVTGNVWTPRFCSRGATGCPGPGLVVAGRFLVVLVLRRRGLRCGVDGTAGSELLRIAALSFKPPVTMLHELAPAFNRGIFAHRLSAEELVGDSPMGVKPAEVKTLVDLTTGLVIGPDRGRSAALRPFRTVTFRPRSITVCRARIRAPHASGWCGRTSPDVRCASPPAPAGKRPSADGGLSERTDRRCRR